MTALVRKNSLPLVTLPPAKETPKIQSESGGGEKREKGMKPGGGNWTENFPKKKSKREEDKK